MYFDAPTNFLLVAPLSHHNLLTPDQSVKFIWPVEAKLGKNMNV